MHLEAGDGFETVSIFHKYFKYMTLTDPSTDAKRDFIFKFQTEVFKKAGQLFTFLDQNSKELDLKNDKFLFIYGRNVLSYLEDDQVFRFLAKMYHVLEKVGTMILIE